MELVADVLDNLVHRAATDFAFLDLAGAPVNDFLPLRFGVGVHGVVEAGDELVGKERPVLFGQGQHLGYFLGSNAHASRVSAFTGVLASLHRLSGLSLRLLARVELAMSLYHIADGGAGNPGGEPVSQGGR
jgi:hypothetical protein